MNNLSITEFKEHWVTCDKERIKYCDLEPGMIVRVEYNNGDVVTGEIHWDMGCFGDQYAVYADGVAWYVLDMFGLELDDFAKFFLVGYDKKRDNLSEEEYNIMIRECIERDRE